MPIIFSELCKAFSYDDIKQIHIYAAADLSYPCCVFGWSGTAPCESAHAANGWSQTHTKQNAHGWGREGQYLRCAPPSVPTNTTPTTAPTTAGSTLTSTTIAAGGCRLQ